MARRKVKPIAGNSYVHDSELALLVDDSAWREAGSELRRVDPKRYVAILRLAREIVEIHRDPLVTFEKEGN
jgi:hypothetical protein